jgi:alpha-1,3-glucan synthase
MWLVPVLTGILGVWAYVRFFYQVKLNRKGISYKVSSIKDSVGKFFKINIGKKLDSDFSGSMYEQNTADISTAMAAEEASNDSRRTVLIATIEYDIEDWNIKVKIGGLGVMVRFTAHKSVRTTS